MKVQVPSFEEWAENKAWSDREIQNHKHDYRIFCDGIAFANEQLEQTGTGSKQLSLMDEDTLFNKYQELKNTFGSWFDAFKAGYELASVSSPLPPTKRPFLSDGEIEENWDSPGTIMAAKWARDRYEDRDGGIAAAVTPWTPEMGMKCVFWNAGDVVAHPGIYRESGAKPYVHYPTWKLAGSDSYMYVAALESLDEIGKPPSYFENRGRATV
jgi:hypothetical protein